MYTVPELPYSYSSLAPFIDEETMHLHHDKHHAGYVKNLNDALQGHDDLLSLPVEELIADLLQVPEDIRQKVKNNGGGHANHTLYWEIMGNSTEKKPVGNFAKAIDATFGGFDVLQEKMLSLALGRFGSGWVWVSVDKGRLVLEDTPNQDSPLMEGRLPILGIDVWEHAYYLTYKNMRADYVKAWWNIVNWNAVEVRYNEAL